MTTLAHTLRVGRQGFELGRAELSVSWTWQSWLLLWIVRMASQAAFIALLGQLIGSPETVRYLVVGNVVIVGMLTTQWTVSSLSGDRGAGVYPLLVIAPTSLVPGTLGRGLVHLLNGVASSVLSFAIVGPLFGVDLPWPEAVLALPLLALTLFSVYCQNVLLAAVAVRVPRYGALTHTTTAGIVQAICGVNVPVTFWPAAIQIVANCLPITHGLQALRGVLDRGDPLLIVQNTALELGVGLAWLAAALVLLDNMANTGRADGSIELPSG